MSNRLNLFLLVLFLYAAPTWSAQMPRGSFLTQPARSAWQLGTQVRANPLVAARYEKHFGVSALQFANYAQGQLGVRALKRSGSYRVFFIKPNGSIGSGMRKLRKGTPVFVHLRTGKPVLLAECGNPMSTNLPGYSAPAGQSTTAPKPRVTAAAPEQEEPEVVSPPLPVTSLPPDFLDLPEMAQMQTGDTSLWEAPLALIVPDLPLAGAGVAAYTAPVSLTPLFMVGASGLFSFGSDAEGRGGTTPPAVPEPASLTLWAIAGGAAMSTRWVRKRRKATRSNT